MAHGGDEDDETRYFGTPYDRETYLKLHERKKLEDDEMDQLAVQYPPSSYGAPYMSDSYKDMRKYLYTHKPEAETEHALVACAHSTRPEQCMVARRNMMIANPTWPITTKQRLQALGRTPFLPAYDGNRPPGFTSLLARRLTSHPITGEATRTKEAVNVQKRPPKPQLLLKNSGGKSRKPYQKNRKSRRKIRKSRKNKQK